MHPQAFAITSGGYSIVRYEVDPSQRMRPRAVAGEISISEPWGSHLEIEISAVTARSRGTVRAKPTFVGWGWLKASDHTV